MALLSPQQIQEQAEFGKISLGDLDNLQPAVVEKAVEAALLAHQDGLFVSLSTGWKSRICKRLFNCGKILSLSLFV